jgi:hypothetical protein
MRAAAQKAAFRKADAEAGGGGETGEDGTSTPTPTGAQVYFSGTLVEAEEAGVFPVFRDGESIDSDEFNELLEVLYERSDCARGR